MVVKAAIGLQYALTYELQGSRIQGLYVLLCYAVSTHSRNVSNELTEKSEIVIFTKTTTEV